MHESLKNLPQSLRCQVPAWGNLVRAHPAAGARPQELLRERLELPAAVWVPALPGYEVGSIYFCDEMFSNRFECVQGDFKGLLGILVCLSECIFSLLDVLPPSFPFRIQKRSKCSVTGHTLVNICSWILNQVKSSFEQF